MILQFQDVSADSGPPYDTGIVGASFSLGPGDMLTLRVAPEQSRTPLPDLAIGLTAPAEGSILFEGQAWPDIHPDQASVLRSRIRRSFESGGWISNLDVVENILLAERYHTERTTEDIIVEALALARSFDLEEIPAGRPNLWGRSELRRAQWVRAFLGKPALIILENPMRDLAGRWRDKLVEQIQRSRQVGAAIIVIADDDLPWNGGDLKPALKFELRDMKMRSE